MDVSVLNQINASRQTRDEALINQQELEVNNFTISEISEESNRKLAVENIVIDEDLEKEESDKKSFFGIIKNAYKTVKMFISKHIKREKEPKLLDTGSKANDESIIANTTNVVDMKDPFLRVETPKVIDQTGKKITTSGLGEKDDVR